MPKIHNRLYKGRVDTTYVVRDSVLTVNKDFQTEMNSLLFSILLDTLNETFVDYGKNLSFKDAEYIIKDLYKLYNNLTPNGKFLVSYLLLGSEIEEIEKAVPVADKHYAKNLIKDALRPYMRDIENHNI